LAAAETLEQIDPHTRVIRQRIYLLVAVLLGNMTVGAVGYHSMADYPWLEAVYMAITTMLTVGYGEILPLGPQARLFNSIYMFVAVVSQLAAVAGLTQSLVEWEVAGGFGKRRRLKMIRNLNGHYIICGYGRVGRGAADELRRGNAPIVVVDRSKDRLAAAAAAGFMIYEGDSTKDETLREVGIEKAKGVIATLGTDADNLFLIISARALNPNIPVVARAVEEEAISKLRRAGATDVRAPFRASGQHLASSLLKPHVTQFFDVAFQNASLDLEVQQITVEPGSAFVEKSLKQLNLREQISVIVLAIRRQDGAMIFNPMADTVVHSGDSLIVMGVSKELEHLAELAEKS
jgi:voltage-gated potassium channel